MIVYEITYHIFIKLVRNERILVRNRKTIIILKSYLTNFTFISDYSLAYTDIRTKLNIDVNIDLSFFSIVSQFCKQWKCQNIGGVPKRPLKINNRSHYGANGLREACFTLPSFVRETLTERSGDG